ncbi:hypothetical protein [Staphylococcus hominis]|uniref:hypothetical protein n=1 Tax=Staphylococcus hominis TaxID=1290 RepID=UPI001E2B7DF0|nr:hypothetical protein [Staphylococcus hominis]
MDNIIFYLGITLFLIACIVIIFGIIAIFKNKNYLKMLAMAIIIILLSMLALGIHKVIESNNPSKSDITPVKKEKPKDNKTNKENNNKKIIILRKIIRIHQMSLFRTLLPLKKTLLPLKKTHPPQKNIQFSHQNHQLHNKKTQLLNKITRLQITKILHNDTKNLQHTNKTHLNIRRIQQIMI